MSMSSSGTVTLPPGVSIAPGRETVQIGLNNQNVQGMLFAITLQNGATTSVFVPYTLMGQTDVVAKMFADRINAINNISTLGG